MDPEKVHVKRLIHVGRSENVAQSFVLDNRTSHQEKIPAPGYAIEPAVSTATKEGHPGKVCVMTWIHSISQPQTITTKCAQTWAPEGTRDYTIWSVATVTVKKLRRAEAHL